VFRAELIGSEETSWEELFAGYSALKAITFVQQRRDAVAAGRLAR
jgi:hypothetical protein